MKILNNRVPRKVKKHFRELFLLLEIDNKNHQQLNIMVKKIKIYCHYLSRQRNRLVVVVK